MSRILGAFGPGHSIEHGGQTFTFALLSNEMICRLEAAYFKRARQSVYAMREELSDGEYERALDRVTDRYNRGKFAFPAGESFGYFLSAGGLAELVATLCCCEKAAAESLCAARSVEVMHVCTCVVFESLPDLKKKILRRAEAGGPEIDALAALLSTS